MLVCGATGRPGVSRDARSCDRGAAIRSVASIVLYHAYDKALCALPSRSSRAPNAEQCTDDLVTDLVRRSIGAGLLKALQELPCGVLSAETPLEAHASVSYSGSTVRVQEHGRVSSDAATLASPELLDDAPQGINDDGRANSAHGESTRSCDKFSVLAPLYGKAADDALLQQQRPVSRPSGPRPVGPGRPKRGMAGGDYFAGAPCAPLVSRPSTTTGFSSRSAAPSTTGSDSVATDQSDQQLLRERFRENMHRTRQQAYQETRRDHVLQEYHWLMRDMQVEQSCRQQEQRWQEREQHRQKRVQQQRDALLEQSEEDLNIRYGRMAADGFDGFSADWSDQYPGASMHSDRSNLTERDVLLPIPPAESALEQTRLGHFLETYRKAVGRRVVHQDLPSTSVATRARRKSTRELLEESSVSDARSQRSAKRAAAQATLPIGRRAWQSRRNPWTRNVLRQSKLPAVEDTVSAMLEGRPATVPSLARTPQAPLPLVSQFAPQTAPPLVPPSAWQHVGQT